MFGSDVESDFEEEPASVEKPSRKRAADGEPRRPPAKRKSRSRTVFGAFSSLCRCQLSTLSLFGHLCRSVRLSLTASPQDSRREAQQQSLGDYGACAIRMLLRNIGAVMCSDGDAAKRQPERPVRSAAEVEAARANHKAVWRALLDANSGAC